MTERASASISDAVRLTGTELCRRCEESGLPFVTTAELEPLREPFGQRRAVEATRFALAMSREGYNLLVIGPHGHGKHAFIRSELQRVASTQQASSDYCYVRDFRRPGGARALCLPAGRARALRQDADRLIDDLRTAIPAALESEALRAHIEEIQAKLSSHSESIFKRIEEDARVFGITMVRLPSGVAFAPVKDGEVLAPDEFQKLPREEQERLESCVRRLQEKLSRELREVPRLSKQARDQARAVAKDAVASAVDQAFEELESRWADLPEVLDHFRLLRDDVLEHADNFQEQDDGAKLLLDQRRRFDRYRVNVFVDRTGTAGAPVVYENRPSLDRLLGRVEQRAEFGALVSDFSMVRAGALHRANGGYLILDAEELLGNPHSWPALKRALYAKEARIESLAQVVGLTSGESLEPQPIALDVRVILVGDRHLYHLMVELDSDVAELFKVVADFEDHIERNPENELLLARFIATIEQQDGLRTFDQGAVSRLVEHSSRTVGDRRRLSTEVRELIDVLHQADHLCAERDGERVTRGDVNAALARRAERLSRLRERFIEQILQHTVLVDTSGERVGQVNGLSVLEFGGARFGLPTRITATARVGDGKVVDIEREVELGGAVHSKGVLILSSYFAARYTRQVPLSLNASLVFEQSYFGVEGDSASLAELMALISALAEVPMKQGLALTGSVSQHGQTQAIGGVNEKIEGFFDVCLARGLTGAQGVIIPRANVDNLVLREDVVAACQRGEFSIYAVSTADEALELLAGVPAGAADEAGDFPEDSVNAKVLAQLIEFAIIAEGFSRFVKVQDGSDAAAGSAPPDGSREGEDA